MYFQIHCQASFVYSDLIDWRLVAIKGIPIDELSLDSKLSAMKFLFEEGSDSNLVFLAHIGADQAENWLLRAEVYRVFRDVEIQTKETLLQLAESVWSTLKSEDILTVQQWAALCVGKVLFHKALLELTQKLLQEGGVGGCKAHVFQAWDVADSHVRPVLAHTAWWAVVLW